MTTKKTVDQRVEREFRQRRKGTDKNDLPFYEGTDRLTTRGGLKEEGYRGREISVFPSTGRKQPTVDSKSEPAGKPRASAAPSRTARAPARSSRQSDAKSK